MSAHRNIVQNILITALVLMSASAASAQSAICVNADAPDGGNGVTWETAYNDLQDALADATAGDEIWVAAGTYKPAAPGGSREATFQLINGVGLYGGFAGNESEREQRDPATNVTILSGDLDGNDGPDFTNYDENSYNVLTGIEVDATAVLDGFTITAGHDPRVYPHGGAGMHNHQGHPTVASCVFTKNLAHNGAGMYNDISSPTVSNSLFLENQAEWGAGIYNRDHADPVISRCVFIGNVATVGSAGGIYGVLHGQPLITNCVFIDNRAVYGAAIMAADDPTIRNCTIAGNDGGHGIRKGSGAEITLTNCILWDNVGGSIDGSHGTVTVSFSDIEGGYDGEENIDADPMFVDLPGGDVHLLEGSPCINRGNRDYDPPEGSKDFDGDDRLQHCRVDMGADETPYYLDCNSNGESDACDIRDGVSEDCNGNSVPDECDVSEGTSADCNENTIPDECDVADGSSPDCNGNIVPDECDILDGTLHDDNGNDIADECEDIHNVTADTWHLTLQLAIDTGADGDEVIVEPGTYAELIDFAGKGIYLHSSGGAETTIIDGTGLGDSVVKCVSGEGTDTVLGGFTITGGSAGQGGGMLIEESEPTVIDCVFSANNASDGAGIYSVAFDGPRYPVLRSCKFVDNTARYGGGGIYNFFNSDLAIVNCEFIGNSAGHGGGGMDNDLEAYATITNCLFVGNMAGEFGGGLYNMEAHRTTVSHCTFSSNSATIGGGGIYALFSSQLEVHNSILWGNANEDMLSDYGTPLISYSNIEGCGGSGGGWNNTMGTDGGGNIDAEPVFVDPANDDYRIDEGSPCIDAADNDAVPADTADLDGDGDTAEATPYDLALYPRFVDDEDTIDTGNPGSMGPPVVDMGAYEFQYTTPDIDGDGEVTFADLLQLLTNWGECPPEGGCPQDLDRDGRVGFSDLLIVLGEWGPIED